VNERVVPAREFFGPKYRQVAIENGEVLVSVEIPLNTDYQFVRGYKQSKRREDDIAITNAGLSVTFAQPHSNSSSGLVVEDVCLAYGGMAASTVQAKQTQEFLKGKNWDRQTIEQALEVLRQEMDLKENAPGGMEKYRTSLAMSFLYSFWLSVNKDLKLAGLPYDTSITDREWSGAEPLPFHLETKSLQQHPSPSAIAAGVKDVKSSSSSSIKESSSVGNWHSAIHASAERQVTGEAIYTDDLPKLPNELIGSLITSIIPRGRIKSIDWEAVKADATLKGKYDFIYSANDVPGSNIIGDIVLDEEVFVQDEVTAVGQPIAIVVGNDPVDVKYAARTIS